MGDCDKAHF